MNVVERMIAAGFDPALAKEARGTGSMECERIRIRMFRCAPWQYGSRAVAVEATAMILFSDGLVKPAPDGWGYEGHQVLAYYPEDNLPFPQPEWPDCYHPIIRYEV